MGTQIITASKLRSQILRLVKELDKAPDQYIITHNGEPAATLMSYTEYRSLLATLDVISDPELVGGIRESRNDKQRGRVHSFDEVFGEPL
ncbi:MAG: type II toxin-antitoxin system Phd/YefM family antitoxin [bacterium]